MKRKLIVSNIVDKNIYHFFQAELCELWDIMEEIKKLKSPDTPVLVDVVLSHFLSEDTAHNWRRDFISGMGFNVLNESAAFDEEIYDEVISIPKLGWRFDPTSFSGISEDSSLKRMVATVKASMGLADEPPSYALLITRKKNRILKDLETGDFATNIFSEYCDGEKIPFKVASFENLSLKQQIKLISKARILFAVHGAECTNLIFMAQNALFVEINFRKHWYCDPVCEDHFSARLDYASKCVGVNNLTRPFHKADIFMLAQLFGHDHLEISFDRADRFLDRNPINVNEITIDFEEIKLLLDNVKW